MKLTITLV